MLKILAVMGSPRLGNTYQVCQRVEEKLKALGEVELEYVFLKDADIQPCRGCFLCTSKGEQHCPVQDDCPRILEKMLHADGVIFASPVYALSVSGLMKNLKDRLAYNAHRPRFFGKHALLIATSAGTGLDGALGYLATFSIWGFEIADKLGLTLYPHLKPTPKLEQDIEKKIDQAARKFYHALTHHVQPAPSVVQLLQFRVLKLNTQVAGDYWLADQEFYQDKRDYYYPTRIAPLPRLAAWLFEKFYLSYMAKNYVLKSD